MQNRLRDYSFLGQMLVNAIPQQTKYYFEAMVELWSCQL